MSEEGPDAVSARDHQPPARVVNTSVRIHHKVAVGHRAFDPKLGSDHNGAENTQPRRRRKRFFVPPHVADATGLRHPIRH
jgi:hypothetical protein